MFATNFLNNMSVDEEGNYVNLSMTTTREIEQNEAIYYGAQYNKMYGSASYSPTGDLKTIENTLRNFAYSKIKAVVPILSGNMAQHTIVSGQSIIVSGPSYDLKRWKRTGIVYLYKDRKTYQKKTSIASTVNSGAKTSISISKSKTKEKHYTLAWDYAIWVNKYGAFGYSHSLKSKHWLDMALMDVVDVVAGIYGATVVWKL